jgi:hypothetical protein
MPISVTCACGHNYQLKDDFSGRQVRCVCGQVLNVPGATLAMETPQFGQVAEEPPAAAGEPVLPELPVIAELPVILPVAAQPAGTSALRPMRRAILWTSVVAALVAAAAIGLGSYFALREKPKKDGEKGSAAGTSADGKKDDAKGDKERRETDPVVRGGGADDGQASDPASRVILAMKFTPGVYALTETDKTAKKMTMQGQKQEGTETTDIDGELEISAPDAAGEQTVRFLCKRIKSESSADGKTTSFDSDGAAEDQDEALASVLRPMVGWEATMTGRNGKFTKVEGVSRLIDQIRLSAPGAAGPALDNIQAMMEKFLKEMLTKHYGEVLPKKAVGAGDEWKSKVHVSSVPLLGAIDMDCRCKLERIDIEAGGKVAVLAMDLTADIDDRPLNIQEMIPIPGVKARVKSMTMQGTTRVRFDIGLGLATQGDSDVRMIGSMTIEAQGQKFDINMDVTTTSASTLSKQAEGAGKIERKTDPRLGGAVRPVRRAIDKGAPVEPPPAATPEETDAEEVEATPATPPATPVPGEQAEKAAVASVEGTIWAGTDSKAEYYEFHFQPGGALHYKSPSGFYNTAATDHWKQDGDSIYMEMTNKYAEYKGVIKGDKMEGNAWNVTGLRWTWTVVKQKK